VGDEVKIVERELLTNGFLKNRTKTCHQFPTHRVDEGK
jgi:predicted RNA binding protein YcfA (HicA-like mRNA interferase family)